MAPRQEIDREVAFALDEIGPIVPWYDKAFGDWTFSHPLYPVECEGESPEEVKDKYPLYLKEFIAHRMNHTLDQLEEKATKGHAGLPHRKSHAPAAMEQQQRRINLPLDLAEWLLDKSHWAILRRLMTQQEKLKHVH